MPHLPHCGAPRAARQQPDRGTRFASWFACYCPPSPGETQPGTARAIAMHSCVTHMATDLGLPSLRGPLPQQDGTAGGRTPGPG